MIKKIISFVSELVGVFIFTAIVIFALSYVRQWLLVEQSQCYWDGLVRYDYCTFVNRVGQVLTFMGLY